MSSTSDSLLCIIACNSDSEILAALLTIGPSVVCTRKRRLGADKFRCSRLVGPGKGFVAIWISHGLSRRGLAGYHGVPSGSMTLESGNHAGNNSYGRRIIKQDQESMYTLLRVKRAKMHRIEIYRESRG